MKRWKQPKMNLYTLKLTENIAASGGDNTQVLLTYNVGGTGWYYCNTTSHTVQNTQVTYEPKADGNNYLYNDKLETVSGCVV